MIGTWTPWFDLDIDQVLTLDRAKRLKIRLNHQESPVELINVSATDTHLAARRRVSPYNVRI